MLIRNYGLFWQRQNVFWGRQKVAGHLKGTRAKDLDSRQVDFREQQGVYVLYDDAFQFVYVGQAGAGETQKLFLRLRQHTRDALADRWSRFSWFGIRWVKTGGELAAEAASAHPSMTDVLNHIEAILISAAEPPHNRQGGRFGDDVEQYLQFRDRQALGPTLQGMIKDLWDNRESRRLGKVRAAANGVVPVPAWRKLTANV